MSTRSIVYLQCRGTSDNYFCLHMQGARTASNILDTEQILLTITCPYHLQRANAVSTFFLVIVFRTCDERVLCLCGYRTDRIYNNNVCSQCLHRAGYMYYNNIVSSVLAKSRCCVNLFLSDCFVFATSRYNIKGVHIYYISVNIFSDCLHLQEAGVVSTLFQNCSYQQQQQRFLSVCNEQVRY